MVVENDRVIGLLGDKVQKLISTTRSKKNYFCKLQSALELGVRLKNNSFTGAINLLQSQVFQFHCHLIHLQNKSKLFISANGYVFKARIGST